MAGCNFPASITRPDSKAPIHLPRALCVLVLGTKTGQPDGRAGGSCITDFRKSGGGLFSIKLVLRALFPGLPLLRYSCSGEESSWCSCSRGENARLSSIVLCHGHCDKILKGNTSRTSKAVMMMKRNGLGDSWGCSSNLQERCTKSLDKNRL